MIQYGYFDSVDGDRKYNADQMSEYFEGLVSNGVYEDVGNAMQVIAYSGMKLKVRSGRAIVNCKWIRVTGTEEITVTQSDTQHDRYSAIVVRLNEADRKIEIACKDGTPGARPMQPDVAANELCLAMVYVRANATEILQSEIRDTRASEMCGWVTGLIEQVDTSQLFLQWQTAYENYYEEMTAQFTEFLNGLTARLNVNTYIEKFELRRVTATDYAQRINLNMDGYTYADDDIVQVYINGLLCTEGVEYTFWPPDEQDQYAAIGVENVVAGTEIKIVVLKSKIAFNTIISSDGDTLVTDQNDEIIE